jgi:hypothetical protein
MYPHELKHAQDKILSILGLDINKMDKVKYDELGEFVRALTSLHYSKGHDDGYGMSAGYTIK